MEKPLHVMVAEALGWSGPVRYPTIETPGAYTGIDADGIQRYDAFPPGIKSGARQIPRYDTDWSATGPLIERFNIHLQPEGKSNPAPERWGALAWREELGDEYVGEGEGPTPLVAICNLILTLKEAGKL